MTDWKHHHPPSDHPDFDAYLDTLTDDDFDAINAAARTRPPTDSPTDSPTPETHQDPPKK
jgi:hypothetical protein